MDKYREIFQIIEECIHARMDGSPWAIARTRRKLYEAVLDYGLTPDDILDISEIIAERINPYDAGSIPDQVYALLRKKAQRKPRLYIVR